MSHVGVLDPKARRSSANNRVNMLALHVRLALSSNEKDQPVTPGYLNEFIKLMRYFGNVVRLLQDDHMKSCGVKVKKRRFTRLNEAEIYCIYTAAIQYFGKDKALGELIHLRRYMRPYAFAKTHRSPQYDKAKAFIEYLSEYDARFSR
jgi:hypothetical protein